jgi:cellulose synthase/poly-beta-1,6-N-acetylglucosamine synthase-like glycosyltransferase
VARPQPRVTVVIVARNEERLIADAISSVLAQGLDGVEIIVVDDRSTDRTAEIAASYPGVRVLSNIGAPHTGAHNLGIRSARADVIARLDADDVYVRGGLRALVEALESHPEVDLVAGGVITVDSAGAALDIDVPLPTTSHLVIATMNSCPITHSAVVYRRAAVLSVGGYLDDRYPGEDYDLWERMLSAGSQMVGIERLVTLRLIRSTSVSALARAKQRDVAEATRQRAMDRWRTAKPSALSLWRAGRSLSRFPEPARRRRSFQYQLFRIATRAMGRREVAVALVSLAAGVMLGPVSLCRAVTERTAAHQRERVARGHPRWRRG